MDKKLKNVKTVESTCYTLINREEKNEHTNKSMSKVLESNTAITLIALIITIIVLLILAGVTLNLVMGESGLFAKAKLAKERTEIAQYEEELDLTLLNMNSDKNGNLNMETIIKEFPIYLKQAQPNCTYEWDTEQTVEEPSGIYKNYDFYIDKSHKAHIKKKAKGETTIETSLSTNEFTNKEVTATIKIKSSVGIQKIIDKDGNEYNAKGQKEYTITETATENTIYKYQVTDIEGKTEEKITQVLNIDKNPPANFNISVTYTDDAGLKIDGVTTDAESEVDKYEYYVKKSTENKYIKYDTNPITGLTSGTYSVYAVAYDKAGNTTKSTNAEEINISVSYSKVTAENVAKEPSKYYGLKVTNYTSANGQNDWRIFYSDGTHIFLITGDYIDTTKANSVDTSETGMTTSNYSAYWNSVPSFQTVNSTLLTRFKAAEYGLQSGMTNSKCVSTLLNTNNWKKYLDKENGTGNADYAIGSPTIEMWIASWNQRYPNDKLYCKESKDIYNPGYYVGIDSNQSTFGINYQVMNKKEGYNNSSLYYPRKEIIKSCEYYWIASPGAGYEGNVISVHYNGELTENYYSHSYLSIRPIVSLKSGITVNAVEPE